MKTNARALLSLLLLVPALMFLVGCKGGYVCQVTFGSSTCTPSGPGSGGGVGGGGGGSSDAAFAYAVDQDGTLDGYTLNTKAGTLLATSGYTAPTIPTSDPGVGMVIAQGQFVYTVFELTGEIYGWSASSSGTLTPLTNGLPLAVSLDAPIVGFNEYNVATNPAGTLLFISSTGADRVFVYTISNAGVLTPVTGSPFTTPYEPGNLTTDGLGNFLYATMAVTGEHIGEGIMAYSIGTGTNLGVLTPVTGSPFDFPMWQVQGDPSGGFLIGTTGNNLGLTGADDLHLYVFSISPTTSSTPGALTQVSNLLTTYSPFTIAVQPTSTGGEFVYSFSVNDGDSGYNPIEGFSLNTSGALAELSTSPFSNTTTPQMGLGSYGQFDQSGLYLFVYSSVTSGGTTVTQLGVWDVGTGGALTQPISPATFTTPGYWAVTDPQ
jgi:hypothetical protein